MFAVQTELAQTIVEQLRGQLTGGAADPTAKAAIQAQVQAAEKGGTKNVEAHESYLQGRFYDNRHSEKECSASPGRLSNARSQLDPNFALAWAGVAQTHVWHCNFATEGGQKASTLIWPPRATQWSGLSPSNPTCRRRCSPGRRSKQISIITGTAQPKHCARLWLWLRQIRRC